MTIVPNDLTILRGCVFKWGYNDYSGPTYSGRVRITYVGQETIYYTYISGKGKGQKYAISIHKFEIYNKRFLDEANI